MFSRDTVKAIKHRLLSDLVHLKKQRPEYIQELLRRYSIWFLNDYFDVAYAHQQDQIIRSYIFSQNYDVASAFEMMMRSCHHAQITKSREREAQERASYARINARGTQPLLRNYEAQERTPYAQRNAAVNQAFDQVLNQERIQAETERRNKKARDEEEISRVLNDIVNAAELASIAMSDTDKNQLRRRITTNPMATSYTSYTNERFLIDTKYTQKLFPLIKSNKTNNMSSIMKLAEMPKEVVRAFTSSNMNADDMISFLSLDEQIKTNGAKPMRALSKLIAEGIDIEQAVLAMKTSSKEKIKKICEHIDPVAVFENYSDDQLKALAMYSNRGLTRHHFKDHAWFGTNRYHTYVLSILLSDSSPEDALNTLSMLSRVEIAAIAIGLEIDEIALLKKNELLNILMDGISDISIIRKNNFLALNKFQQEAILILARRVSPLNMAQAPYSIILNEWFNTASHVNALTAIIDSIWENRLLSNAKTIHAACLILANTSETDAAILEKAYNASQTDIRAQIMHDLQMYIERIQLTALDSKNGKINFEHDFWFFKASRAQNRKANYDLAIQLRNKLNDEKNDIKSLFSDKEIQAMRSKSNPTRAIHSTELNAVIRRARTL